MGADEAQIEGSFGEAIRIAKEQKSISLQKRAEASYAEYRRQKATGSGGLDSDHLFGRSCISLRFGAPLRDGQRIRKTARGDSRMSTANLMA